MAWHQVRPGDSWERSLAKQDSFVGGLLHRAMWVGECGEVGESTRFQACMKKSV